MFAALHRRIGVARAAATATTALVVGSSTYVEGYDLNTEHLLVVTGSAAVLLALLGERTPDRRLPGIVGLLGGVALLTKAVFVLATPAALIPLLAGRAARGQSVVRPDVSLRARARAGPRRGLRGLRGAWRSG